MKHSDVLAHRNGFIDKAELRDLLESTDSGSQPAAQHWLAESAVDTVLSSYDKDGDQRISFAEFAALVRRAPAAIPVLNPAL